MNFCFKSIFAFITSLRKVQFIHLIASLIILIEYFNLKIYCLHFRFTITLIVLFKVNLFY